MDNLKQSLSRLADLVDEMSAELKRLAASDIFPAPDPAPKPPTKPNEGKIPLLDLVTHLTEQIDSRLGGANPETAKVVWSTKDHVNGVYRQNPDCFLADLPDLLSCVAVCAIDPNSGNFQGVHGGTLIAPDVIIFAKHARPVKGKTFRFVRADGTFEDRKMTDLKASPHNDIAVGVLDSELPSDFVPAKFFPANYKDYLLEPYLNPVLFPRVGSDQEKKLRVGEGSLANNYLEPTDAYRATFYEKTIGGDSGSGIFHIVNGEHVVGTCYHYPGWGPDYADDLDLINSFMTQLGSVYQLTEVDLSGFAIYPPAVYHPILESSIYAYDATVSATLKDEFIEGLMSRWFMLTGTGDRFITIGSDSSSTAKPMLDPTGLIFAADTRLSFNSFSTDEIWVIFCTSLGTFALKKPKSIAWSKVGLIGGYSNERTPNVGTLYYVLIYPYASSDSEIVAAMDHITTGYGDEITNSNFANFFRERSDFTEIILPDMSAVTSCLRSFKDNTVVEKVTMVLTGLSVRADQMFDGCTALTTLNAGCFDGATATNFTDCFRNTNLTETSIDNVLVSLNSNGTSGGTFGQTGGSAPSATGEAAIDAMRARGWTVSVTGGY